MSSKGSKPATTTTSSSSTVNLPDWLTNAAQQAVGTAQDLSQRPYTPNPNQQVAPLSADTTQAFQQVRDLQGSTVPAFQAAQQQAGGLLTGAQLLDPNAIGADAQTLMNPYIGSVIAPSLTLANQQLGQNLRQIGANANNANAFGGSRQGIQEGTAIGQEAIGAGQLAGNLLNTGYNTASQQAMDIAKSNLAAGEFGIQQLPALATGQVGEAAKEAGLLQTAGTAEQQQAQSELDAQNAQWAAQQNWPIQNLDILLSAVGGVPYGTTTAGTSTQQQQTSKNLLGNIVGGASTGAGIGASFGGVGAPIGAVAGGLLGAFS